MQLKLMKQPSFQKDYSRDSLFSMCEEASALMNSKVDERLEAHQIALRVSEKEAIVESLKKQIAQKEDDLDLT